MGNKRILLVVCFIYTLATTLGLLNATRGNFSQISWAFVPLGIFIWGDALVIGPFMIFGSIWLWFKHNVTWTRLFLSAFIAVRSFIEVLYNLNAQFSLTLRPWETNWQQLSYMQGLNRMEVYVVFQLLFTCIFITSSLMFLASLKRMFTSR